jgi:BirA family biotin operon repressor/biotin-[acetyl-CoA-carboxylase] ligase
VSDADDLRSLRSHLRGATFGHAHEHHASIASTNDRAAAWAREGAPHGAVVTADAQTAGRGRRGRPWYSPAGASIYASVVVRPGRAGPELGAIGLAVGLGLRDGLPALQRPVGLKWPNDLVVGDRKLCGILCESRWLDDVPELVVGFGINVHQREFPEPIAGIATSLALEAGTQRGPDRAALLADVLEATEAVVDRFVGGGFAAIREAYTACCTVLGRTIEIDVPTQASQRRRVVAEDLDHDGALRVRPVEGGASFRVEAADVWLAR